MPPEYKDHVEVVTHESVNGDTYPCPAIGNPQGATEPQCRAITSSPVRTATTCVGCHSPWRLCRVCVLQGVTNGEAVVANYATGLCAFHDQHGTEAKRSRSGEEGAQPLTTERVRPRAALAEDAVRDIIFTPHFAARSQHATPLGRRRGAPISPAKSSAVTDPWAALTPHSFT